MRSLADAINSGDLGAALALWEPQACIVGADGSTLAGHDALAGALSSMIEHGTRFEAEVLDVYAAGDLALVTGNLTLIATDGTAQRSRSLVVHRRGSDGRWRIALDAPWGLPDGEVAGVTAAIQQLDLGLRLREAGEAFARSHDSAADAIADAARRGMSAAAIAEHSGLSPQTVGVFLRHMGLTSEPDEAGATRVA